MTDNDLYLFGDSDKPTCDTAWALYEEGLMFNQDVNLDEIVETNENFYIGKRVCR